MIVPNLRLSRIPTAELVLMPPLSREERRNRPTGDDRFSPKGEKNKPPKRKKYFRGGHNKDRFHK